MAAPGRKQLSLSVDLDAIGCYYRIHALGEAPERMADTVMQRALPRFLEVLAARGLRATFFWVGSDLEGHGAGAETARGLARQVVAAGHEIANHTFTHPYHLTRLPPAQIAAELERAHGIIGEVVGVAPVGFRAPGYGISGPVLEVLARLGYRYDSSIFAAPGYWAAKVAVMGVLGLMGRASGAVITDPRALFAPTDPYRPEVRRPWRRGQASLVELPIGVTPFDRVPVIGTNLLIVPAKVRAYFLARMRPRPFFNLELHGVDLLDAQADGIPRELSQRQPDLRVPLLAKRKVLEATLDRLRAEYDVVTLAEVAAGFEG